MITIIITIPLLLVTIVITIIIIIIIIIIIMDIYSAPHLSVEPSALTIIIIYIQMYQIITNKK